jgi:hypothetical protein
MFGLFKKKKTSLIVSSSRVEKLCELYAALSNDVTDLYHNFPGANPAELRFFSMSATSVFVQAFGKMSTSEMHDVINQFTEQCVANMLFYMPKADYSIVHHTFISRFGVYASLIVDLHNSESVQEMQDSNFALINAMDDHFGINRDAIDRSLAGLELSTRLTEYAIYVRDAIIV